MRVFGRYSSIVSVPGLLLGLLLATAGSVQANPGGASVVHGQVSFNRPDTRTLNIVNSPGAIINWQQFNIDRGETTRFIQRSTGSAVLNRVTGQDPSQILGRLQSNGRVFLINPNGVIFGRNAVVNTSGLVASTLNISNRDFINGRLHFSDLHNTSEILNRGFIAASRGGEVVFVAPKIRNDGVIRVDNGSIVLAAGQSVTLNSLNYENIEFEVQAAENEVINLGEMIADGGSIGVFAGSITSKGLVSANAVTVDDAGNIVFVAKNDAVIEDGTVTASSKSGRGGRIHVLGDRVGIFGKSEIDASGNTGGGEILLGGDFQGRNPELKNARQTVVSEQTTINADATGRGDGGKVIVWANETTAYRGSISARGGQAGGNGGLVEVSGKQGLAFDGGIDTSAVKGQAGRILLDPDNITIQTTGTDDLKVGFVAPNIRFTDNPATDYVISAAVLEALIGDITLQAEVDISLLAGTVLNLTNQSAGTTVTFQAGGNISIGGDLLVNGGNLVLSAADPAASAPLDNVAITIGGSISTSGGDIFLNTNNATTGAVHLDNATTLDNQGRLNLVASNLYIDDGSTLDNNGVVDFRSDIIISSNIGGGIFNINDGAEIRKSGGSGNAHFDPSLELNTNNARMNAMAGSLLLQARTRINGSLMNTGSSDVIFNGDITLADGSSLAGNYRLQGGALNIASGTVATLNNQLTWDNTATIGGGGTLVIASDASFDLVNGVDHIIDNATTVDNRGTTKITAGTLQINNGSVFDNNGLFDFVDNITVSSTGGGSFNLNDGAEVRKSGGNGNALFASGITLNTANARFNVVQGNGAILLQGNTNINGILSSNTSSSDIVLNGTVTLANGSSLVGDYQLLGGSLTIAGGETATIGNLLVWNGDAVVAGGGSLKIASGALLDLSGAVTRVIDNVTIDNQGTTRFTAGSFRLDNSAAVNNTGLFEFAGSNFITGDGSGSFGNNGGTLRSSATGTAGMSAGVTYTHTAAAIDIRSGSFDLNLNTPLVLNAGDVLEGSGTFIGAVDNAAGTVRPGGSGNTGTLAVTGDYTQQAGGQLEIEIAGSSNYDALDITGAATLAGGLTVSEINGFDATTPNSYDLVTTTTGTSGGFDGKNIYPVGYERAFASGNSYQINDMANNIVFFDNFSGDLDWNNAGNWSTGQLPFTGLDIDTTDVTAGPIVVSGGVHVVNNLTTATNIENSGGSLTVTGDVIVPDSFTYTQTDAAAFTRFDGNFNSASAQSVKMVNDLGEMIINGLAVADLENNALLGGAGTVEGKVLNNGVFGPGNAEEKTAVFTIIGDLLLTAGSDINVDTAGLERGTEYDAITVNGNIAFNGDLNVRVDGSSGYIASVTDTFEVFRFSGNSGSVAINPDPGYTYNIELLSDRLNLVTTAVPGKFLRDTQNDVVTLMNITRDMLDGIFTRETGPGDTTDETEKTLVCS